MKSAIFLLEAYCEQPEAYREQTEAYLELPEAYRERPEAYHDQRKLTMSKGNMRRWETSGQLELTVTS